MAKAQCHGMNDLGFQNQANFGLICRSTTYKDGRLSSEHLFPKFAKLKLNDDSKCDFFLKKSLTLSKGSKPES